MGSVRKHVDRLNGLNPVGHIKVLQVACLCGRIAAHVDNAFRGSSENGLYHIRVHTSPGRVGDDYIGAAMLRNEIIDPLGIDDDHFLMLPTRSEDFPAACRDFKAELDRRGGIDLLVLGLGENGHLGFNQPGSPFDSRTRVSVMYPELEERIRRETGTPPEIPLGGVTLGLADIMEAKRILLVAKGRNKAAIVRKIIKGPVTEAVPASILQNHPNCEYLLDHLAASHL